MKSKSLRRNFLCASTVLLSRSASSPACRQAWRRRLQLRRNFLCATAILLVACGCQKKQESQPAPPPATAPALAPSQPAMVSAEKNSFDAVTAKLDKGGNFFLYLSTERLLSGLPEHLAAASNFVRSLPNIKAEDQENIGKVVQLITGLVNDSGLEQISGVGMSSIAREPGLYLNKLVVHHYPGKASGAIWSLFGQAPHPLKELDLLPETTALAVFADLDFAEAWSLARKQVASLHTEAADRWLKEWPGQFEQKTGLKWDDCLASLPGGGGIIFTLDEQKQIALPVPKTPVQIPEPGLVIVINVKNDLIFDRVDQVLKGNQMLVKVDAPDLKSRTVPVPLPIPIELRVTLARSGDYLLLASSDKLIQEIMAVKEGKKKGYKGSDEFKKLAQGLPVQGNNFTIVSSRFAKAMRQAQQQILSANGALPASQLDLLQKMLGSGTDRDGFSVGANGPEGWEGIASGNQSANTLLVAGGGAFVAGLLAAIAVPNFIKARETAQHNAILNNLRLMEAAKQQFVLEKNKAKGDEVTLEDLRPYLGGGLKPVVGERYIPNPVGTSPAVKLSSAFHGHPAGSEVTLDDLR